VGKNPHQWSRTEGKGREKKTAEFTDGILYHDFRGKGRRLEKVMKNGVNHVQTGRRACGFHADGRIQKRSDKSKEKKRGKRVHGEINGR